MNEQPGNGGACDLSRESPGPEVNGMDPHFGRELARSCFEGVNDALLVVDPDTARVLDCNPAALRLSGFKREELWGRDVLKLLGVPGHPDGSGLLMAMQVVELFHAPEAYLLQCKEGAPLRVDLTISRIRLPARPLALLVVRDISACHSLEQQLRQAQKLETLGRLAGGMAHDLNNLILPIMGYADLAQQDLPPGSSAGLQVSQVVIAAERAKNLVQQILLFSHQEPPQGMPVSLQDVVLEVLKLLSANLARNVLVREDLQGCRKTVIGNATQLYQVVMNLCTNALQAMTGATRVLTVRLEVVAGDEVLRRGHPQSEAGEYVCLTVGDTGEGIDPAVREHIFEPFFTTRGFGGGTGLGLSVVQGIVRNHGGEITVESELGQGSTFRVYLPAADLPVAVQEPVHTTRFNGSERVLLVEDQEPVAQLGREMLERIGYQVEVHTRSQAALERFLGQPDHFDLVITDQVMPELTGDQLARSVLEIRPDMPILLITGHHRFCSPDVMKFLGFRDMLLKPFTAEQLGRTVRQLLDAESRRRSQTEAG